MAFCFLYLTCLRLWMIKLNNKQNKTKNYHMFLLVYYKFFFLKCHNSSNNNNITFTNKQTRKNTVLIFTKNTFVKSKNKVLFVCVFVRLFDHHIRNVNNVLFFFLLLIYPPGISLRLMIFLAGCCFLDTL